MPIGQSVSRESYDPIAQSFFVKSSQASGVSYIFVSSVDLFFRTSSSTNGVTVEVREVINGYPSKQTLPFAKKRLSPGNVNVSANGSSATSFTFDNPVRLYLNREYAIVIIPDAFDPTYEIYTSKVGEIDLETNQPVIQDWGDGALFTSTNGTSWKPYEDEDIKFRINRYTYNASAAYANLVPNDYEFLTVSENVDAFIENEIAYTLSGTSYTAGLSSTNLRQLTIASISVDFSVGDYILLEQNSNKFISKVESVTTSTSTVILMESPATGVINPTSSATITASLINAGRVSYFNNRSPDKLHVQESGARADNLFEANTTVYGFSSSATAKIESIDDIEYSYFQPLIYYSDTLRTNTTLALMDGATVDQNIPFDDNSFSVLNPRTIPSKSNIVNASLSVDEDFILRTNMTNNGFTDVTPIVDVELSRLDAYQYNITESNDTTSRYISKPVFLKNDMAAAGFKVLLAGFRPPGTYIDVFVRFVYPTNVDSVGDWIQLDNANPTLFSNAANVKDYRDFVYDLDEETYTDEYIAFQVRIDFRLATSAEITADNLNVTSGIHLFPHVYDYRAIAIT